MTESSSEFKPTAAMRRCKALLHKACSDRFLHLLTPEAPDLVRYVTPTPMPLVRKWIRDSPDFWPWLLTPVDADADSLHARELAYAHLCEVLTLNLRREDGSIDHDVLKAKQKVADLLLGKGTPLVQLTNANTTNTLHASHAETQTLAPGGVPRGLKGKNAGMIERRIQALEAPSLQETIDVPKEEDL